MPQRIRRALATCLVLLASCSVALAQSAPPPYVLSSPLLPLILQAPGNTWIRVNANFFNDVWTPDDLEPLDHGVTHTPSKIILAWSGFAWDSNRGDLIIYGGGHANYSGNDVYRWHSSTLQWERASLPSEIVLDPVAGYLTIDGVDHSPISAHTYRNNIFLPIVDRFMTWGGATYENGGPYIRVLETDPTQTREVGPYLFDPNKADGNKVGGITGSHVQRVSPHPEVVGGNMWENRDLPKNLAGQTMPGSFNSGCATYTSENGRDVIYLGAANAFATNLDLYRYQLTDIAVPTADQIAKVGAFWVGTSGETTCGLDPSRKLFVRTGTNSIPFTFWDLNNPGPSNPDWRVDINPSISAFQAWLAAQSFSIGKCAMDFDPVRHTFPIWCGGPTVWDLQPPLAGNVTAGWSVTQRPPPASAAPTTADQAIYVLGKWHYAPYYDVFLALENENDGDLWVYKPATWVQPNAPGNALPTVSVTAPAPNSTFVPGAPITLTAAASDSDGSIARVEYYVNGTKVGQAASAPYTVTINPILVGSYGVVAVAVDNAGGMAKSTTVSFTIAATLTTQVLQQGLNGYVGAVDTYLDATAPSTPHDLTNPLLVDPQSYRPLLRFAVFQSEGGPVPNGSVVQSASLSLYKGYYNDTLDLYALLRPWVVSQATWTTSQAGSFWSVPGAGGNGTDIATTPDSYVVPDFNPGWVTFDVTTRVRQWSGGAVNYGWRLSQFTTGINIKGFDSAEFATDPTLRPKLTVVYSGGTTNQPPTVALTSPANGSSSTLGASIALAANAADSDGSVTKVEFFANGVSLGVDTTAPYGLSWTPAATGTYSLTAVATDNGGLATTSAPVSVTVTAPTNTTVVLQQGLNGYTGATDTYLDAYLPTFAHGLGDPLYLDATSYRPLVRFAIFQSEGGPVPNGASIQSATLAMYKNYYNDTLQLNALLKPWSEAQATWAQSQTGVAWTAAGASAAGSDYNASADASVAAGFNPGWISFDVTSRVALWSGGSANYGWRMTQTTTGYNAKTFDSASYATDPTLRPKLTVVYR